jgi:NIMA (never in mitosis gene a)-related kinase
MMLEKDPKVGPSINQVLTMPFIKAQLPDFFDRALLDYEIQHTSIHGVRLFIFKL